LPTAELRAHPTVEKEQQWLPRLGPLLPLPIPVPLGMGVPSEPFPWHWSIYRWLEGEVAAVATIEDRHGFASALAEFLAALHHVDPTSGPAPGPHNFYRGGALQTYDAETRKALAQLQDHVDVGKATAVWEAVWRRRGRRPLWKALITLAKCVGTDASVASEASRVIGEVLADREHHT
jgi:aminoglycoside phosphotransferase (APT) family kinase protein